MSLTFESSGEADLLSASRHVQSDAVSIPHSVNKRPRGGRNRDRRGAPFKLDCTCPQTYRYGSVEAVSFLFFGFFLSFADDVRLERGSVELPEP